MPARRPLGFIVHEALRGGTAGDLARLAEFRERLYFCFQPWGDALFELVDALAGASRPVRSVAELMFEPASRRGWGSLYQALEQGGIDVESARELLVGQVRPVAADRPLMFAIDASKYPRPDSRYVADVGMQYAAERERYGGAPAVPGSAMQWVTQVDLSTARSTSPSSYRWVHRSWSGSGATGCSSPHRRPDDQTPWAAHPNTDPDSRWTSPPPGDRLMPNTR
jgi:hypothetical protein